MEALNGDYEASPLFDDRQKSVIRWAEAVTINQGRHDDAAFDALREHFNEAEIAEITLVTGMFNMINRVNDSLRMEVEPAHYVDRGQGKVRVDPAELVSYVERVSRYGITGEGRRRGAGS
jgi:hypothetical protein